MTPQGGAFIIDFRTMAHKKAAGSADNLKTSNPKYRGVKLFGGQVARAGNIIIRQKGDKYEIGNNVFKAADFSIHAKVDGVVTFTKKNVVKFDGRKFLKTFVHIVPHGA
jgi:large subunit ribosomal protein L27